MNYRINKKNLGRFQIISAAVLWSLAGICVRSIPWSPFSIMAARCFIGIFLIGASKRSYRFHFTKMNVLGGIFAGMTGVFYMLAIKLTTAATAIILQYTAPIFVYIFTVFFQKVQPRLREIIILIMVFSGCVLFFADNLDVSALLGNIIALGSGFTMAGQIIVFNHPDNEPLESIYFSNWFGFLLGIPFLLFDGNLLINKQTIFWILIMGFFQYGLANILYSLGCRKIDKIEISILQTIEPVVGPILVMLLFNERLNAVSLVGFIIVLLGVTTYGVIGSHEK